MTRCKHCTGTCAAAFGIVSTKQFTVHKLCFDTGRLPRTYILWGKAKLEIFSVVDANVEVVEVASNSPKQVIPRVAASGIQ